MPAPFEIIAAPATVYVAPLGTAFPVVNVAPAVAWVNMGKTEGGVTVRHSQSVELLRTDQNIGPVKALRSEETHEVEFQLAELHLENFARALNNAAITTAVGPPATKSIKLRQGWIMNPVALLIRGPSPYGEWSLQYEIPSVVQTGEPEVAFVKDDKAVLNITYTAIEATGAIEDSFGRLIAQSA